MLRQIFFIACLCFISYTLFAQKEGDWLEKNNILKVNLSALAFKNISVQYEVKDGKKASVAVNLHTIPYSKLPFQNVFKDLLSDNPDIQYDQFKLGSFGVITELRYYLSKRGAFQGFYLGPFLGYNSYKMNLPIKYNTKMGDFGGKINVLSAGIQIGAQFHIGKSLVLDWWILGPNYGSASGKFDFIGTLSGSEQDELRAAIETLKQDIPFKLIKTYVIGNGGGTFVTKGPWAGIRALGINLGIRF